MYQYECDRRHTHKLTALYVYKARDKHRKCIYKWLLLTSLKLIESPRKLECWEDIVTYIIITIVVVVVVVVTIPVVIACVTTITDAEIGICECLSVYS